MQPNVMSDPTVVAIVPDRDALTVRAAALKISDQSTYTQAGEWLKSIKGFLKVIEAARVKVTGPLNEALKARNAEARDTAQPLLDAEAKIKRAMIAYSDEQDRLQREEQRREDELAERERARLQEIADRAAAKGQESKAEVFQERAAAVLAPVVVQVTPKVAGISTPVVWDFEITDEDLVPRAYCDVSMKRIRAQVQATKGLTQIEGVRVFKAKRVSAGAA
jgi:site-specific DNA-cytosine methylase